MTVTHPHDEVATDVRSANDSTLKAAFQESCVRMEDCIRKQPTSAVLTGLGIGVGVGVLVGLALGAPKKKPLLSGVNRGTAERVGQQVLDAISHAIPESLSKHFH